MNKPLSGVRIIDLTRVLAGPYCTMILADLGAEVIKIEKPGTGDDSRAYGPFKNNQSLYYMSVNRGKKSVTLDLKNDYGLEILYKLIKKADVLIENFRPSAAKNLKVDYESIKEINPKIIHCSISGFGQTGPLSEKPAYDMLVQAMSGMMSINGWKDRPPARVGISIGDLGVALFASNAITTALYAREKTKKGQSIDISMLDSQIALLENALIRYQVFNKNPGPLGDKHPTIAPFQTFKTKDEYIAIALGNDKLWKKFCVIISKANLIDDPRFVSNKERVENVNELQQIIESVLQKRGILEWGKIFDENGIPYSPVNKISDVLEIDQLKDREMLINLENQGLQDIQVAGNPIKFRGVDQELNARAPNLGEHTREILQDLLKLTDEEIKNS